MKRLLLILFLILLLACNKRPEPVVEPQPVPFAFSDTLLRIDSLMQHDADSALLMLTSFRPTEGSGKISSTFNANYQSLLLSEALYKTDNPQLNRFVGIETFQETSLQDAMRYFDSIVVHYPGNDDLIVLSARSHYMNGVGFYENDSVVEACKEYLHTLEIMEGHFDEKQLVGYKAKFMGLTYTRLGEIFLNNGLGTPAIDSYNNAINYFALLPNYSLANTFLHLGTSYLLSNRTDSAFYCYNESINLAMEQNRTSVLCGALGEIAPLYYEMGYKDSAFMMIRKAILLSTNDDQYLAHCFTYGYLLSKECRYDSAIYYLKQSVNRNTFATKTVSAELLVNCYQTLGDTAKMQYYKTIYGDYFSKYRSNSDIMSELSDVYEIYTQKELQKEYIKTMKERNCRIITYSSVIFVIVFIFVVFVKKKFYIKEKAIADMQRKLESNPFINEPICKSILTAVSHKHFKTKVRFEEYKEYALSKNQLLALRDAVDRHFDNFTQKLRHDYPELSNDDIDCCCLLLLGLKDVEVSALIQKDYSTINRRKHRFEDLSIMDKIRAINYHTTS